MQMKMTHNPLARALAAAGVAGGSDIYTYQDYLYELCADGHEAKPVSEHQWDMICDMQGSRRLYYASNVESSLKIAEKRA